MTVTWVATTPRLSGSPVTGRFFANDGSGAFNIPSGTQPLFSQTFSNINFNPLASIGNLARPFTAVVTDPGGTAVGTIPAQGNNYQAGVGSLYSFSAVFTGSLNVPSGRCLLVHLRER